MVRNEIGVAAGTASHYGTGLSGMVKAGHFSDMSTIKELAAQLRDNKSRLKIRSLLLEFGNLLARRTESLNQSEIPIIVLWNFSYYTAGNSETIPASALVGHYRVVVGYDDANQEILILDPWS
jgi:hypothetical protein